MTRFNSSTKQSIIDLGLQLAEATVILVLLVPLQNYQNVSAAARKGGRSEQSGLTPVVLVPGDGGSQLEARLDKPSARLFCRKKSDWFQVWIELGSFVPGRLDCLLDNIKLEYNRTRNATENPPGVEIRESKFGEVESVEFLDSMGFLDYFRDIIAILESTYGYKRNANLVAAPYDFRKAPNELGSFFVRFSNLIERTSENNSNFPVTIICHSMGCLFTQYLLNQKTRPWREKYVKRMVSISSPWSGSFKAITTLLFGDNLSVAILNPKKLRPVQITYPSLMFLFPKQPGFLKNQLLVGTKARNYTTNNLEGLFKEIGLLNELELYRLAYPLLVNLKPPKVELWCVYGKGVSTPVGVIFNNKTRTDKSYKLYHGDGDGTVNLSSLKSCDTFKQNQPIFTSTFPSKTHMSILRSPDFMNFLVSKIMSRDLAT